MKTDGTERKEQGTSGVDPNQPEVEHGLYISPNSDGSEQVMRVGEMVEGPIRGNFFRRAWEMYRDGFRTMTWGRSLWILMLVKLFIMFAILKAFFFPNFLSSQADTEEGKSEYVVHELVDRGR